MKRSASLIAFFIAIGHVPQTELSAQVELHLHMDRLTAMGDFRDRSEGAWGGGLSGVIYGNSARPVGLRVDASAALFGKESDRVPLSSNLPSDLSVAVATTNSAFRVAAGPQIVLSQGRFRPYVFGTIGMSHFSTRTSVTGAETTISSNTHESHTGLTSAIGAGIAIDLRRREKLAIGLFFETSYRNNGMVSYLSARDVQEVVLRNKMERLAPVEVSVSYMATSMGVAIRGFR